ncbi:guanylate kinase [Salipaludibacillus sp. CF4.18]|uniref:guanylate kinase n=1 Tax=Salipaludibacillus sp. CF4.18 TaxID=3373081 RepID=UPI003EE7CA3D
MSGNIIILSGYSASGKNTIINAMDKKHFDLVYLPSVTTRKVRKGESQGNPYTFVTEEEFLQKVKEEEFIEYEEVHGNFYGTPKDTYRQELKAGKTIIKDIDVNGAIHFKEVFGDAVTLVFVQPSDEDALKERLLKRGDDEKDILLRLKRVEYEKSLKGQFDYVVVNDVIAEAVRDVENVVKEVKERNE